MNHRGQGLSFSADWREEPCIIAIVHLLIICLSLHHHTFNHVCMYLSSGDYLPSYWCKHLEKQQTTLVRYEEYEGSLEGKLYEWFLQASIRKQVLNIPNPYSAALFRSNQIWSIDFKYNLKTKLSIHFVAHLSYNEQKLFLIKSLLVENRSRQLVVVSGEWQQQYYTRPSHQSDRERQETAREEIFW